MALILKSLADGNLKDTANKNLLYPGTGTATKAVVVKSMRFVNVHDTGSATLTLKLKKTLASEPSVPTVPQTRQLTPTITVPSKGSYVEKREITLGKGDTIEGTSVGGNGLDYVISGIEREL